MLSTLYESKSTRIPQQLLAWVFCIPSLGFWSEDPFHTREHLFLTSSPYSHWQSDFFVFVIVLYCTLVVSQSANFNCGVHHRELQECEKIIIRIHRHPLASACFPGGFYPLTIWLMPLAYLRRVCFAMLSIRAVSAVNSFFALSFQLLQNWLEIITKPATRDIRGTWITQIQLVSYQVWNSAAQNTAQ